MSTDREQKIFDYLDNQLSSKARSAFEKQLSEDPDLQAELNAVIVGCKAAPEVCCQVRVPRDLKARCLAALDAEVLLTEVPAPAPVSAGKLIRFNWKPVFAIAAALIVLFGVYFANEPVIPITSAFASDFTGVQSGNLEFNFCQTHCGEFEGFCKEVGLDFSPAMISDCVGKFNFVGGSIHPLGKKKAALFAFKCPEDNYLVCEMFEGRLADFEGQGEMVSGKSKQVMVISHKGMTSALWEDGDMICVMTSDTSRENVVKLALLKAEGAAGGQG